MVLALQALLNLQASSSFYQLLILARMPQQLNDRCNVISITYVHEIVLRKIILENNNTYDVSSQMQISAHIQDL